MSKHTATPWHVVSARGSVQVWAADHVVAQTGQSGDNAAHIVRCVNAHGELVAALTACERALADLPSATKRAAWQKACKALALAAA